MEIIHSAVFFGRGGILIESMLATRLKKSAASWGKGEFMVIGGDSLNGDKLRLECHGGGSMHVILGYVVDFENLTVTHPKEKVVGSQIWVRYPVFTPRGRIIALRDVQELRGQMARWKGANNTGRLSSEPVNRISPFADSAEIRIRCSKWNFRRFCRSLVLFLRDISPADGAWSSLFSGHLEELVPFINDYRACSTYPDSLE